MTRHDLIGDSKVVAVDFDGTLCTPNWPGIGDANTEMINYIKYRQAGGDKIILWTARDGDELDAAVKWCREQGLIFDAVNDNLPEMTQLFGSNSRKIFADEYIDDKNQPVDICLRYINPMYERAKLEVAIACEREKPDREPGEFDYGCACYESALKAFESLTVDGHSGYSIQVTKAILDRLIDGKPLTPITEENAKWKKVATGKYQSIRMTSLFKKVGADGTTTYDDIDRVMCVDISNPSVTYHSGFVRGLVNEMYPITMPYTPSDEPIIVCCEDFLAHEENGNFDTIGVVALDLPDKKGPAVPINRYFKSDEHDFDFVEIDSEEYLNRRALAKELRERREIRND